MLNKIFLIVLAVSILAMAVLSYFSYDWLQSIDKPANVAANFDFYNGLTSTFLWISSLLLLIFANVLLWRNRNIWSLWVTFAYFAVFVLLNTFWIGQLGFAFKKDNGLADGFTVIGILGAVLCVIVGLGVFFDQFIVLRFRDKMHGQLPAATYETIEVIETKDDDAA